MGFHERAIFKLKKNHVLLTETHANKKKITGAIIIRTANGRRAVEYKA